jgi:hypothetical protein
VSVVYLGARSVGGSVPGLKAALDALGVALGNLETTITAQVEALLTAKAAIRIPAIADFQAQLDASLSLTAGFTAQLTDPALYVSGLLAGVAQVQANLGALVPVVALDTQIAAGLGIQAALGAKIAAVDVQLAALVSIQLALSGVVSAAGLVLGIYAEMSGAMAHGGVFMLAADGQASSLGAELDATIAAMGFGPTEQLVGPIVLVQQANSGARAGISAVFEI